MRSPRARDPFQKVKDHVPLPGATRLAEVDEAMAASLTPARNEAIVAEVPEEWVGGQRGEYVRFLVDRLAAPRPFIEEALRAHARLV